MRDWIKAFLGLAKIFAIYLPCIVFLALPAMLVGYIWCWIVGGFRAGELAFTTDGSDRRAWTVRVTREAKP